MRRIEFFPSGMQNCQKIVCRLFVFFTKLIVGYALPVSIINKVKSSAQAVRATML